MDWQQFVIQLTVTLVPVAIALIRQNGRIAALETENAQLKLALGKLQIDHDDLQKEYKANLRAQAGMRDTF